MKKSFEARVLRERVVNTEKYRYTVQECYGAPDPYTYTQWLEIRRLPLEDLGTTAALTDWETVKVIR